MPDVSITELAGERVVVRRFRPEDVAEFVACRSDAEVARYQSWDVPYSPDEGEHPAARRVASRPRMR
jgi:RimJ/RimL family protein N-acetyltransferase